MHVQLRCKKCGHGWVVRDEPQSLVQLHCPACAAMVGSAAASEDFASALEDALAQLWSLREGFEVTVTLGTESIPAAFSG